MANNNKEKPIVFISHASEDKVKVEIFRKFLDEKYVGSIEFFSTTELGKIGGLDFYKEIGEKLKKAQVQVLYITLNSINKRWLYYEAGGGHFRGIPVIPVCSSEISIESLLSPLKELGGCELKKIEGFRELFSTISKNLGYYHPKISKKEYRSICGLMGINQVGLNKTEEIKNIFANCKTMLKSNENEKVILGLQIISIIKPPQVFKYVTPHLFSKDSLIRFQARDAIVIISPKNLLQKLLEETIKNTTILKDSEKIRQDFYMLLYNISIAKDIELIKEFKHKHIDKIDAQTKGHLLELEEKIKKKYEMHYSGWRDELDQYYLEKDI